MLVVYADNGRTLGRITRIENSTNGRLGFNVTLARSAIVPELGWPTSYWTIWANPDDQVEVYERKPTT